MSETQTNVGEAGQAAAERIAQLEAALAAATAEPEPEVNPHDLNEVFVPEGQGTCLQCSCEEWGVPRQGDPYTCWLCGHHRGLHKRHPAGAQARQP